MRLKIVCYGNRKDVLYSLCLYNFIRVTPSISAYFIVTEPSTVRSEDLRLTSHHKRGNFQGLASLVGGIGDGHRTVVVESWFSCQQGNMIDADNCLVNVAPALAAEVECP